MTAPRFGALQVVELGGSIAGAYCAKLFADHGAIVTLARRPGDVLPPGEAEYLHQGKRAVGSPAEVDLDRADVVIDSSATGSVEPLGVGDRVVAVRLSPFGTSGPYSGWRSADIVEQAMSGHLYLNGSPEREPLRGPPHQPAYAAALFGFVGAMAALMERRRSGRGQIVEVSHLEAMVALHQFTLLRYLFTGDVLRRMGNRFAGQGQPNGLYPCADGWVAIAAPNDVMVERVLAITGLEHLLDHPRITSPLDFQTSPELLDDHLVPWLSQRTTAEVVELFQAVRIPCAPASSILGLLDDEQLNSRGYWDRSSDATVALPGPPLRLSRHPWCSPRTDAAATAVAPIIPGDSRPGPSPSPVEPVGLGRSDDRTEAAALAGVKVLDLTRVWAGPLATRILAELGADVVWVEAPWSRGPRQLPESMVRATRYFPADDPGTCPWNRNGHFVKYALGKRSLVLDLQDPRGVAALERLVPAFDVLIENYSPRVMPQLGLDEEHLRRLNPDLVYVTMPGYGRTGPMADWLAYGSSVDSHAGLSSLTGYPDASPWKGGIAWPDPITGLHATAGALIALWDRDTEPDGGGQTVETSMLEATVAVLGGAVVEAQRRGADPEPLGNRDPVSAPQGVYRCAGEDRWIAISVPDDTTWASLCGLAGMEHLRHLDLDRRRRDSDEIDRALAAWTAGFEHRQLMSHLQEHGVPAGAVLDASELVVDPHLTARSAWAELDQPAVGPFRTPAIPIRLSRTPARVRRPAPLLGEHNEEVLASLGGLDPATIDELESAGVVVVEPPG